MRPLTRCTCLVLMAMGWWNASCVVAAQRPNILWLVAEDFGPHLGCYGTRQVHSPNLDRLAAQGVRYSRCYTTSPVCSASRSAFITGMYQTTIGAHNHRSHRDDGFQLPDGVRTLPAWLRDAGYYSVLIERMPDAVGFTGSLKTDWNFTPPKRSFDSIDWADLSENQPFFAMLNFQETHRQFKAPRKADPAKVEVPPYEPDHPVVRADRAAYLDAASELDRKVGRVLDQLRADRLADNTVIVFFGDHGEAHVRGKQFCYEEGLHVPLIIYWPTKLEPPKHFRPGTVDDRLLEAIDLAPTMLALAGHAKPPAMQGRIFLGDRAEPPRRYVFGARDRCDETVLRIRTVSDGRYRYIRNFLPDRPLLLSNAYKERRYPGWNLLKKLHTAGKLTPAQARLCEPTMPPEELYDLQADPHQIDNLADQPQHAATREHLRQVLDEWIEQTNDQGTNLEPADLAARQGVLNPETPPNRGNRLEPIER